MLVRKFNVSNLQSRKAAQIRNRYNPVPHLTQDTTWEIDTSFSDLNFITFSKTSFSLEL